MNRMTGQLTTLSYTYVDLARTLEQWPADPVTAPCLTGNSNVVQLVSDAVGQMARATQRLVSELGLGPGSTWYDSANFGEAVKRALKNRSAIEVGLMHIMHIDVASKSQVLKR
uniref:MEDS domain-containing protein n=1 Tax=Mesocestoides corti TaxID=53468 RepID=A0A5K3FIU2_MESCO